MKNKYQAKTAKRWRDGGYIKASEYIPDDPMARDKLRKAAERICRSHGMDRNKFRSENLGRNKS